ncbi:MAG: hypothetical protein E6G14_09585 [Actinobacteria bacterium]|nr:MAG: hypothetical protein E6G14_09585 [Actinomycetota bacterium]
MRTRQRLDDVGDQRRDRAHLRVSVVGLRPEQRTEFRQHHQYRIVRADHTVAWVLERGQHVIERDARASLHGVIFEITERKHAEEVLRRHEAEQARIAELEAARARIIAAEDATRRQIERDLHDGAQQRLVILALTLRMIKAKLADDRDGASVLLDEAIDTLAEATDELRELARGIHPAVLTDLGLARAVAVLAERTPLPVDVHCSLSERLPGQVEVAAYYVVAESLTNVARYSEARKATIRLGREGGCAFVDVEDDGIGGAEPEAGSGIRGLIDRIDALDGSLDVRSEPGQGARIQVRIPLASAEAALNVEASLVGDGAADDDDVEDRVARVEVEASHREQGGAEIACPERVTAAAVRSAEPLGLAERVDGEAASTLERGGSPNGFCGGRDRTRNRPPRHQRFPWRRLAFGGAVSRTETGRTARWAQRSRRDRVSLCTTALSDSAEAPCGFHGRASAWCAGGSSRCRSGCRGVCCGSCSCSGLPRSSSASLSAHDRCSPPWQK